MANTGRLEMAKSPQSEIEKSVYYKLSPATYRYRRLMQLADERDCRWQEVVNIALDIYLELSSLKVNLKIDPPR